MRFFSPGEAAVFSPDGMKVAFTTENRTGEGKRVTEVRLINADGKGEMDPVLDVFDESGEKVLLTSSMTETPRRKGHPLKSSGWLNERDIWEVSLDGKKRKMLIENGFLPVLIKH